MRLPIWTQLIKHINANLHPIPNKIFYDSKYNRDSQCILFLSSIPPPSCQHINVTHRYHTLMRSVDCSTWGLNWKLTNVIHRLSISKLLVSVSFFACIMSNLELAFWDKDMSCGHTVGYKIYDIWHTVPFSRGTCDLFFELYNLPFHFHCCDPTRFQLWLSSHIGWGRAWFRAVTWPYFSRGDGWTKVS